MTENEQRNGCSSKVAQPSDRLGAVDDTLPPAQIADLVAEAVMAKLQENAQLDAFLDEVIGRVVTWHRVAGLKPIAPRVSHSTDTEQASRHAAQMKGDGQKLYYKRENDPFSDIKARVLVSTFDNLSREGGIFELDFAANTLSKVFHTNGRGLTRFNEGYLFVSRNGDFFRLDDQLNIKQSAKMPNLDQHGIACGPDGLIYIVETRHNRIGIFRLNPFERVDELIVTDELEDRHHINDICFKDGTLLLSMFSTREPARQNFKDGIFDGAIIEFDLVSKKPVRRLAENLRMPHTILFIEDRLCYCESHARSVAVAGNPIASFPGYTRGLDCDGRFLYVGQSSLRHQRTQTTEITLSNDAGIHILDMHEGGSRFIPIPCTNIYSIVISDRRS